MEEIQMKYNRNRGYRGILNRLWTPKAKEIVGSIGGIVGIVSFVLLLGIVGGIECDNISIGQGILYAIPTMIIMAMGFMIGNALLCSERDIEDEE